MGYIALTILFIILKLFGAITWSWLWVLCPIWIGFIIYSFLWLATLGTR